MFVVKKSSLVLVLAVLVLTLSPDSVAESNGLLSPVDGLSGAASSSLAIGVSKRIAPRKSEKNLNSAKVEKVSDRKYPKCVKPELSDPDSDGWGWENSRTCKNYLKSTPVFRKSISSTFRSASSSNSSGSFGVVYENDFEQSSVGPYSQKDVFREWNSPSHIRGFRAGKTSIFNEGGSQGKVLKIYFPRGQSGFQTSSGFRMNLPENYEEVYLAFDMKLAPGFNRVFGGKLPGLCGGRCPIGSTKPSGYDGWSVRSLWQADEGFASYIYHASQKNQTGDIRPWRWDQSTGEWHRVQYKIRLNQVGLKNGLLEIWLDGKIVLVLNNIEFRRDDKIGVDTFYFSSFFGGQGKSMAPESDTYILFDNFVISSQSIY